mgnify:CR=1 FL=1
MESIYESESLLQVAFVTVLIGGGAGANYNQGAMQANTVLSDLYLGRGFAFMAASELVNGLHGNGVLQYADGRRYEGMFRDGMRSGRGTLTYPNGIKYVGDWAKDRPNGRGILTAGTDTYSGGWVDGCFKDGSQKAWLNKTPKECGFSD